MHDSNPRALPPSLKPADRVRQTSIDLLRKTGQAEDGALDLGACALALGSLDRPAVSLDRYSAHLDSLVADAVAEAKRINISEEDDPERVAEALRAVICERYGYAGDEQSYDDQQNANLIRVIDRRRGLPVALGILFIHAARGIGCGAAGLNFPGHFVVRLNSGGQRAIIDPFNGGKLLEAHSLRDMLKTMAGSDAELGPSLVSETSDRQVLLRLQNNIKSRFLRTGDLVRALVILDRMLLLAPREADLWREAGILDARQGNLMSAIDRLGRYMDMATDERGRYRTSTLIQELRNRLH